jgi:hypothetical protein
LKIVHLHTTFFDPVSLKYGAVESLITTLHANKNISKNDHSFFLSRDIFKHIVHLFKNNYDVAILHDISLLKYASILKVSKVFCVNHSGVIGRGNDTQYPSSYFKNVVNIALDQAFAFKFRNDINYIVLNKESYRLYRNNFGKSEIFIGRNCVEIDMYQFTNTNEFKGLSVGNDNPIKRFNIYKSDKYQIDFFGVNKNAKVKELSRKEIFDIYSNYKFLMHLSYSEGQSIVLIEALIAGLHIIISSNVSSNFRGFEKFITVIPEADINNEEKLKPLIDLELDKIKNEPQSYSIERARLAKQKFSPSSCFKRYDSLINRGVKKKKFLKWVPILSLIRIALRSILKKERTLFLN